MQCGGWAGFLIWDLWPQMIEVMEASYLVVSYLS